MPLEDLASLFDNYFDVVLADSKDLKRSCYEIRYEVYCAELKFEDSELFPDKLETDSVDLYSHHFLLRHKSSGKYAGTIRLVDPNLSKDHNALCPFEKYCLSSIDNKELHPQNFSKGSYCEASRLAVPQSFRRRLGEQNQPFIYETDRVSISMEESKAFPYISVGLYLAAAADFLNHLELQHSYVMMEPRLARHLCRVGIEFKQVGKVIEYHGQRAAFHVNRERLLSKMHPNLLNLYRVIEQSVIAQSGRENTFK